MKPNDFVCWLITYRLIAAKSGETWDRGDRGPFK